MLSNTDVGMQAASMSFDNPLPPISRVTMFWGDGDSDFFTSGDDTGYELIGFCPSATQSMADDVLASIKGFEYKPFSAKNAAIDPAAELGDSVTIGGLYSFLADSSTVFDTACLQDISAPADTEIDHEFPYISESQRKLSRKVSLGTSYYGAKITRNEGLTIERLSDDQVKAKVVLNADELTFYDESNSKVLFFDIESGTYKFTGTLNVNDNFVVDTEGNVKISAGVINIADNFKVDAQGNVYIAGVTTINGAGQTQIKGSSIETDSLDLTGAIRFTDLSTDLQSGLTDIESTATSAQNTASLAASQLEGWTYAGSTMIDGSKIETGTVRASILAGGQIQILNADGNYAGQIVPNYDDGGSEALLLFGNSGLRLMSFGNVYLATNDNAGRITIGNGFVNCGNQLLENGVRVATQDDITALSNRLAALGG